MATSTISKGDVYSIGDTFTNRSYERGGYLGWVTTGSSEVFIAVTLDKPMADDITGFTVNGISGLFRGTQGYIDGITSATELTNVYDVTVYKTQPNMLKISFAKGSAMSNATNNTPVACLARMSITFS